MNEGDNKEPLVIEEGGNAKASNPGYKYGKWRQGMSTDAGTPLKKNGRKKGVKVIDVNDFALKMGKIMNYHTLGKTKIENSKNKEENVIPNEPLTLIEACREVGISYHTFRFHLNTMPEMLEQYELMKIKAIDYKKELSENIIEKALSGRMKTISEKDVVDTAKWMLEKTDNRFNPKHIVEAQVEAINVDRSSDDILADIADIIQK